MLPCTFLPYCILQLLNPCTQQIAKCPQCAETSLQKPFDLYRLGDGTRQSCTDTNKLHRCLVNVAELLWICRKTLEFFGLVSVLSVKQCVSGRTETSLPVANTQAGIAQMTLSVGNRNLHQPSRRPGIPLPPHSIFLHDPVSVLRRSRKVLGYQNLLFEGVDKKNQLDVTFCILYFSSNSCSTCFGQPCAHHQELTTA